MAHPWFDLHRHDEYSSFDGFGKATDLANLAAEYGYTALGISNHGNTNGLVQHYMACKAAGIKPILGVEGYYLPKYKEKHRGFHLCLFAKDQQGYRNINELQYEGEKQKYYNPIWTTELLRKYSKGVICTSACIAGYLSQCIVHDRYDSATAFIQCMKSIYGSDFYIEVQPYKISEPGLQERVNFELIKLAKANRVKVILTSDSHRGRKDELETYIKMHEIAGHDIDHIRSTYKDRYMPEPKEIMKRFVRTMSEYYGQDEAKALAKQFYRNSQEIQDKVEEDIFKDLKQTLPNLQEELGVRVRDVVRKGLKAKGKWNPTYKKRAKEELEVIEELGFDDYFLMVADYVNWAKSNGITVGPGRGSACNSIVAYAMGITEVDSILFGLDFRRFLRKDKKKMPDIDVDFAKSRRQEVIEYIINRYPGHTARIASYGLYKVDNLINDLAKVCGLGTSSSDPNKDEHKKEIKAIKEHINKFLDEETNLDAHSFMCSATTKKYNALYDNICLHFMKMYKKVRFIGTHAAGVAITGGNILDYTSIRISKDGDLYTNYDLNDMENIHVIKFDILGLVTMEEIGELRAATGCDATYEEMVVDDETMEAFSRQDTTGVFQFDKPAVKALLEEINCDCFDDIVAANAINRPGPLSMGVPKQYAYNKEHLDEAKESLYYKYTKESYGVIIYQEQIQKVCVYMAGLSWGDADKVMKMIGGQSQSEDARLEYERNKKELGEKFISGAISNGISKRDANALWESMLVYSFNKGHSVGYSLISTEEMYYKVHYPTEFWWAKLKYCPVESNIFQLECEAVKGGNIILPPHVNGTARHSIQLVDGDPCILKGLTSIKGVGEKAAEAIEQERIKNGPYTSPWDFQERVPSRQVNARVYSLLKEAGALTFKKSTYFEEVKKYNIYLMSKAR